MFLEGCWLSLNTLLKAPQGPLGGRGPLCLSDPTKLFHPIASFVTKLLFKPVVNRSKWFLFEESKMIA